MWLKYLLIINQKLLKFDSQVLNFNAINLHLSGRDHKLQIEP